MFSTFKSTRKWLLTIGGLLTLFGLIAFTETRHQHQHVREVIIRLSQVDGYQFLTKRDVMGYLTNEGADPVRGKAYADVDLRRLERRLRQHGLVKKCQIARDLAGNLLVMVEQPRPVARSVMRMDETGMHNVAGQYVSEEGRFFPISMNYTARVPILTGTFFAKNRSLMNPRNRPLLDLLNRIQADPLWRAQIAQLSVDEQGDVVMWPQLGNHRIELGPPTNLDAKLEKLKLFYTDVLPAKGWDRYRRVNVQYRNQLVCE